MDSGELSVLFLLFLFLLVYFAPWLIAGAREHSKTTSIGLTNLLFGWTLLGWGIALIWAFSEDNSKKKEST